MWLSDPAASFVSVIWKRGVGGQGLVKNDGEDRVILERMGVTVRGENMEN